MVFSRCPTKEPVLFGLTQSSVGWWQVGQRQHRGTGIIALPSGSWLWGFLNSYVSSTEGLQAAQAVSRVGTCALHCDL